jgi:RNA polymerase sigma-70 factor (ECF subfamily)
VIGDGVAFAALFDLHRSRAFRHAYRLLQDADDAEDTVAVAFMELWRSRHRVRVVDGSVLPWLLVTVANTARNLSRARRRHRALLESLPRLTDALRGLSAGDLHLVNLVIFEGYSPTEAARLLGISAGAARTRLHRLRASLREQLETHSLVLETGSDPASTLDGGHL